MTRKILIPASLLVLLFLCIFSNAQVDQSSRVKVQMVTDEADAVLPILDKKAAGNEITDSDWQPVFSSEVYFRIKKREMSMGRSFEDEDFKKFALSDETVQNRLALAATLAELKKTDVVRVAQRPLSYLPANATIRAKIYPVIKPKKNTFVFGLPDDPAIFLYLDPGKSRQIFENEFAHELHHIGYGTACPDPKTVTAIKKLSPDMQRVMKWMGAFGEGFAMLGAAGSADVDPHEFSLAEDRERWVRDVANFDNDLRTVEKFFLDLSNGQLSTKEESDTAASFYGVQGPWYTVGWQMAVVIEKTFGRGKLIECMCDRRKLLPTYNKAVKKFNRKSDRHLAIWSKDLIAKLK
jgi:hypothetical protein